MLRPCDICGSDRNVTWWHGMSTTVCDDPKCSDEQGRRYEEGVKEDKAMEQYAREMGFEGIYR